MLGGTRKGREEFHLERLGSPEEETVGGVHLEGVEGLGREFRIVL